MTETLLQSEIDVLFRPLVGYLARENQVFKNSTGNGPPSYTFYDHIYKKFEKVKEAAKIILDPEIQSESPHMSDQIPIRMWNGKPIYSAWGPRYSSDTKGTQIREGDLELQTIDELSKIFSRLKKTGYDARMEVMYADVYGTEINGFNKNQVSEYYESLKKEFQNHPEMNVKTFKWSDFIKDNIEEYEAIKRDVSNNFNYFVKKGTFRRSCDVSEKLAPGLPVKDSEKRAKDYSVERVVEATLINNRGQFKISLSTKNMDCLERTLPRIYPIKTVRPWRRFVSET